MYITDILSPKAVKVPLVSTEKKAVIDELVDLLNDSGLITDPDTLKCIVWEREQQRSTGIGDGLAIPHGRSDCSEDLVMAIGRPTEPIHFESLDNHPVELVVLLASPPTRTVTDSGLTGSKSRCNSAVPSPRGSSNRHQPTLRSGCRWSRKP